MIWRYALPLLAGVTVLTLSACDSKPAVRRDMADCKLDSKASGPSDYLQTCMENRGFLLDAGMPGCPAQPFPAYDENCSRPNGWMMEILYRSPASK